MKKVLGFLLVITLVGLVAVANGQGLGDMKGKMMVGGLVDYSIGFGDAFEDYEFSFMDVSFKTETKLGLSFGGKFMYGLAPKIAIGGVVDYQTIKYDVTTSGEIEGFDLGGSESSTESWISINANAMYFFTPDKKMCPYIEGGPGYYLPSAEGADGKFGFNAGVGAIHMFNEKMGLDFGGRFHMVTTEGSSTTWVEIHAGLNFLLGSK